MELPVAHPGRRLPWNWILVLGATAVGSAAASVVVTLLVALATTKPAPFISDLGMPGATAKAPRYEILERDGDNAKEIFFIRLFRKPALKDLVAICHELKAQAKPPRTIVWFGLGDGNPKSNPWASADCDPEPKVEIRGLTPEQEATLVARPPPDGDVIGRWVEDAQGRELYTISRRDGRLFLEWTTSPQGKGIEEELVEMERSGLRRFQRRTPSRAGDHYVINGYGDLEIRDDHGLILVARRVR
jgi:hypothetical protein